MVDKSLYHNLAIFGGCPAFKEPLHVGRPNVGDRTRLIERMNAMLDRNWLTNNGPAVREFEERIAERAGVAHCIAMCNATVALEILLRAAGLTGEVIVPSYTFIATAHALQWQGITPVFCDLDPVTHNIDPRQVERRITPRTTGILGVHLWGRACNIDALTEIAERRNLTLLFDAAHAFGCSHRGQPIGGFGLAEVFSFHATKILNTFEGGAVVTNNHALAAKLRLMKNFGFAGYDNVVSLGSNGKMTEASAVMGLTNLESLEEFIAINRRNYHAYRRELKTIPGITLLTYDESEACNYQYIVIEVDAAVTGVTRDYLAEILHAENVLARRYFHPGCHNMEPYRSRYPEAAAELPETERVAARALVLPTGKAIAPEQIEIVCDLIRLATKDRRVREHLSPAAEPVGANA